MSGDTWYMSELYRIYPQPFKKQPYQLAMISQCSACLQARIGNLWKTKHVPLPLKRATTAIWTKTDLLLPSESSKNHTLKPQEEKKTNQKNMPLQKTKKTEKT